MIVATAGHIDHGKTTLVKAITGIDTDRLPEEKARADELIAWLLANDAEMFRRAGLRYLIWDKKRWSTIDRQWKPYDGFDASGACASGVCRDPHTSHVHFSFGKAGADGQTSFYRAIAGHVPPAPPAPLPLFPPGGTVSYSSLALGFVAGLGAILTAPNAWAWIRRRWEMSS